MRGFTHVLLLLVALAPCATAAVPAPPPLQGLWNFTSENPALVYDTPTSSGTGDLLPYCNGTNYICNGLVNFDGARVAVYLWPGQDSRCYSYPSGVQSGESSNNTEITAAVQGMLTFQQIPNTGPAGPGPSGCQRYVPSPGQSTGFRFAQANSASCSGSTVMPNCTQSESCPPSVPSSATCASTSSDSSSTLDVTYVYKLERPPSGTVFPSLPAGKGNPHPPVTPTPGPSPPAQQPVVTIRELQGEWQFTWTEQPDPITLYGSEQVGCVSSPLTCYGLLVFSGTTVTQWIPPHQYSRCYDINGGLGPSAGALNENTGVRVMGDQMRFRADPSLYGNPTNFAKGPNGVWHVSHTSPNQLRLAVLHNYTCAQGSFECTHQTITSGPNVPTTVQCRNTSTSVEYSSLVVLARRTIGKCTSDQVGLCNAEASKCYVQQFSNATESCECELKRIACIIKFNCASFPLPSYAGNKMTALRDAIETCQNVCPSAMLAMCNVSHTAPPGHAPGTPGGNPPSIPSQPSKPPNPSAPDHPSPGGPSLIAGGTAALQGVWQAQWTAFDSSASSIPFQCGRHVKCSGQLIIDGNSTTQITGPRQDILCYDTGSSGQQRGESSPGPNITDFDPANHKIVLSTAGYSMCFRFGWLDENHRRMAWGLSQREGCSELEYESTSCNDTAVCPPDVSLTAESSCTQVNPTELREVSILTMACVSGACMGKGSGGQASCPGRVQPPPPTYTPPSPANLARLQGLWNYTSAAVSLSPQMQCGSEFQCEGVAIINGTVLHRVVKPGNPDACYYNPKTGKQRGEYDATQRILSFDPASYKLVLSPSSGTTDECFHFTWSNPGRAFRLAMSQHVDYSWARGTSGNARLPSCVRVASACTASGHLQPQCANVADNIVQATQIINVECAAGPCLTGTAPAQPPPSRPTRPPQRFRDLCVVFGDPHIIPWKSAALTPYTCNHEGVFTLASNDQVDVSAEFKSLASLGLNNRPDRAASLVSSVTITPAGASVISVNALGVLVDGNLTSLQSFSRVPKEYGALSVRRVPSNNTIIRIDIESADTVVLIEAVQVHAAGQGTNVTVLSLAINAPRSDAESSSSDMCASHSACPPGSLILYNGTATQQRQSVRMRSSASSSGSMATFAVPPASNWTGNVSYAEADAACANLTGFAFEACMYDIYVSQESSIAASSTFASSTESTFVADASTSGSDGGGSSSNGGAIAGGVIAALVAVALALWAVKRRRSGRSIWCAAARVLQRRSERSADTVQMTEMGSP